MDFYHGTNIANLTELKPFAKEGSNLQEACVYLSTTRQVALFYIWDFNKDPIRRMMMDIREDKIVFQEMFGGALERFYKETSGYTYHCVGDYEMSENHGVKTCAISKKPVFVSDCEYIKDVYERYEQLPQYRHDIIRGIVMRSIKKDDLLSSPNHPNYLLYQEKYPKYWEEAVALDQHHLL